MIPMVFMFVTTMAALVILLKDKVLEGNYLLSGISVVLLVLALLLAREAWGAFKAPARGETL